MRALAIAVACCAFAAADPAPAIRAPRALPRGGTCLGFTAKGTGGVFVTARAEARKMSLRLLYVAPGDAPNVFLHDAVTDAAGWERERAGIDAQLDKLALVACRPVELGPAGDTLVTRGRSRFVIATRDTRVELSRNGMPGREIASLDSPLGRVEKLDAVYVHPAHTVVALRITHAGENETDDRYVVAPLE